MPTRMSAEEKQAKRINDARWLLKNTYQAYRVALIHAHKITDTNERRLSRAERHARSLGMSAEEITAAKNLYDHSLTTDEALHAAGLAGRDYFHISDRNDYHRRRGLYE